MNILKHGTAYINSRGEHCMEGWSIEGGSQRELHDYAFRGHSSVIGINAVGMLLILLMGIAIGALLCR